MTTPEEFTATLSRPRPGEQVEKRVGAVSLEIVEGPHAGARFEITQQVTTIGRNAKNHIALDDDALSGTHVELTLESHGVLVRDLGSRNGTWHGVGRLRGGVLLPDGADFLAGSSRFLLRMVGEVEVALFGKTAFHNLLGASEEMRKVFAKLDRLASTPLTALVLGETGTGKDEVARAIHKASGRGGPFVVLDCGSLPRELAEAAIFGHRRGAFTGAQADHAGAFEEAAGGTLFLDEIGELPVDLQPKLLRALDRHEVQRIGEHQVRAVDVRVIAATHRDLISDVAAKRFREDLYYRLAQVVVHVPPLRARPEDIELLARHFAASIETGGGQKFQLGDDAIARLRESSWPGNVRQLKNAVQRACYLARAPIVTRHELFPDEGPVPGRNDDEMLFELPLKDAQERLGDAFARRYCERALADAKGDLDAVAQRTGYTRKGLRELLKRLGLLEV